MFYRFVITRIYEKNLFTFNYFSLCCSDFLQ